MHGVRAYDGHTRDAAGGRQASRARRAISTAPLVVAFQPARRGRRRWQGDGRGRADQSLRAFQEIYGMHNMPGLPGGEASRSGRPPSTPRPTISPVDVVGRGSHAARPHAGADTTVIASHIVVALQTIASRNAGSAEIAGRVGDELPRTGVRRLQTSSPSTWNCAARSAPSTRKSAARRGALQGYRHERGRGLWRQGQCPRATAAHPRWSTPKPRRWFARDVAKKISGIPVIDAEAIMGGEDFAYMLEACRPGAYIQIGNGDTADVHHPPLQLQRRAPFPHGTSCTGGRAGRNPHAGGGMIMQPTRRAVSARTERLGRRCRADRPRAATRGASARLAPPVGLELDLGRTAMVIVDMQNAFCAPGGLADLGGFDLSPRCARRSTHSTRCCRRCASTMSR